MSRLKIMGFFILLFSGASFIACRDIILEFKGAYFLPSNKRFRKCYKGTAIFGPELSVQLKNDTPWYAFASLDYLKQKGRRLSSCDSTKIRLLPLALGIKYFIPLCSYADLYLGLGFQATNIRKRNRNACVKSKKTEWGFGGIGKLGTYIQLPHNFVLDLFCDYSFAITDHTSLYGPTTTCSRAHINGAIFGAALGYQF